MRALTARTVDFVRLGGTLDDERGSLPHHHRDPRRLRYVDDGLEATVLLQSQHHRARIEHGALVETALDDRAVVGGADQGSLQILLRAGGAGGRLLHPSLLHRGAGDLHVEILLRCDLLLGEPTYPRQLLESLGELGLGQLETCFGLLPSDEVRLQIDAEDGLSLFHLVTDVGHHLFQATRHLRTQRGHARRDHRTRSDDLRLDGSPADHRGLYRKLQGATPGHRRRRGVSTEVGVRHFDRSGVLPFGGSATAEGGQGEHCYEYGFHFVPLPHAMPPSRASMPASTRLGSPVFGESVVE